MAIWAVFLSEKIDDPDSRKFHYVFKNLPLVINLDLSSGWARPSSAEDYWRVNCSKLRQSINIVIITDLIVNNNQIELKSNG